MRRDEAESEMQSGLSAWSCLSPDMSSFAPDGDRRLVVPGDEWRELKRLTIDMVEAFDLDRRIEAYSSKRTFGRGVFVTNDFQNCTSPRRLHRITASIVKSASDPVLRADSPARWVKIARQNT